MIPQFPDFKKITLDDRKIFESYTQAHHPYSTFNFTNVWIWGIYNDRAVSELNGNLVVRFTDYSTQKSFLSFLGTTDCENTARQLLDFAENSSLTKELRYITEESIRCMTDTKLHVKEDRENFDYIYSIPELAKLVGSKFKKRRHLAKRFQEAYPDAKFEVRSSSDPATQEQIRAVFQQWKQAKILNDKTHGSGFEEQAIDRLLNTASQHPVIVSCIFLHETMLGFSIDEIVSDHKAMAHFIKADNSYKGIYEFLNEQLAYFLSHHGIVAWNWQQDLNIAGLRATKMSYSPIGFLKKYSVSKP